MKNVIVVGLAKSGVAASRLLAERGDTVFITEIKDNPEIRSSVDLLIKENVVSKDNIEIGSHAAGFIKKAGLMVVSPGVAINSPIVRLANDRNIPVIGELELAYSMCKAPIIAVTGTSGKTTVTTLIGQMLKRQGLDAVVCGNIGNPFCGEIKKIKKNSIVVLEASSFQLECVKTFKPWISIVLNISDNHLDRHKDLEEYISLKARIFLNQDKDDFTFLNKKDKILKSLIPGIKSKVEFFNEYKDFSGRHDVRNENYLAAMSAASLAGAGEEAMLEVISGFNGIEHRLEHVAMVKGIYFINDSKATTVSSVEWALKSLDGRIILIMGGRYKGGDFSRLEKSINEKVSRVIAIGEARPRIKKDLSRLDNVFEEEDLEDAVRNAFNNAAEGDKVLLSPGCSSFDMFKNYEERGKAFKELCLKLQ
ncbi:MAG: UDP-N-acetylmuramoyl-L-alanine--D-glutamate ligase [Candidatus Omnitrophota bacterium]